MHISPVVYLQVDVGLFKSSRCTLSDSIIYILCELVASRMPLTLGTIVVTKIF